MSTKEEIKSEDGGTAGKSGLFSWLRGTSGRTAGKLATSDTIAVPQLKAIKTPHEHDVAISHPELASPFSPSDIGIWEVNKDHKSEVSTPTKGQDKKGFFGFR